MSLNKKINILDIFTLSFFCLLFVNGLGKVSSIFLLFLILLVIFWYGYIFLSVYTNRLLNYFVHIENENFENRYVGVQGGLVEVKNIMGFLKKTRIIIFFYLAWSWGFNRLKYTCNTIKQNSSYLQSGSTKFVKFNRRCSQLLLKFSTKRQKRTQVN